jgi:hypothetical protein
VAKLLTGDRLTSVNGPRKAPSMTFVYDGTQPRRPITLPVKAYRR